MCLETLYLVDRIRIIDKLKKRWCFSYKN